MSDKAKARLLNIIALAVSVIPPLVATAFQFPVWIRTSEEATLSGTVCFLAFLCCVPLYKKLGELLRSPSAPVMWLIFTVFMYVMKSIAEQMFTVGVVGVVSNIVGWFIFKCRDKYKKQE